jgi:DNA-binding CsgD family transcriptional regulator
MWVVGRDSELRRIAEAITDGPGLAVVSGPAGIGKSAVVEAATAHRRADHEVLAARGIAAESGYAYAVLADLLRPFTKRFDDLPAPQRAALEIALALRDPGPEPVGELAVALAVTNLLQGLSRQRPVLVVVDDVPDVDAASATVLAFVLRRLAGAEVAVLLGWRTGTKLPAQLADAVPSGRVEVELEPLSGKAIESLLRHRFEMPVAPDRLQRVVELASGNALAAIEFARAELGGRPAAATAQMSDLLAARLAQQPPEVHELLRLVAVAGRLTVPSAENLLRDLTRPLAAAVDAGLLAVDGTIGFAHPLLSAAMIASLDPATVRATHAALAQCDEIAFEQRARDAGLAAVASDASAAQLLEEAAEHALGRGASWTAGDLAALSFTLTPDSHRKDKARRGLRALWHFITAVDDARESNAMSAVRPFIDDDTRAEFLFLVGTMSGTSPQASIDVWSEAARLDAGPAGTRALAYQAATMAVLGRPEESLDLAGRAVAAARRLGQPGVAAAALYARLGTALTMADPTATEVLGDVEALVLDGTDLHGSDFVTVARVVAAAHRGADREALELTRRGLEAADARGVFEVSEIHRASLVIALCRVGEASAADELTSTLRGRPVQPGSHAGLALALHAAYRGRSDDAIDACASAIALASGVGLIRQLPVLHGVLGFALLPAGRVAEAAAALRDARRIGAQTRLIAPIWHYWHADLIEALTATGELDEADEVLAELRTLSSTVDRRELGVLALRCTALVAMARGDLEPALAAAHEAASRGEDHSPLEYGRTLLVHGVSARRAKQRAEARSALTAAVDTFARIDSPLWRERAVAELARVGVRAAGGSLTGNEQQIADLVATGNSNREIAAAMHLSVKTVEYLLTGIYRKVGVYGRTQLAAHRRIPR